ncbi:MAG: hypothetical protein ACM3W4_05975 [Ignavibacteriales bacterium]
MSNSGAQRAVWTGAALLCGAALAWQIVTSGMAAHYAGGSPEAALHWNSGQADALAALSEQALAEGGMQRAADLARRSLAHGPLESAAYRVLAQATAGLANAEKAGPLMGQAGLLTRRDTAVSFWLYRERLLEGRYADAFLYADAVMRRAPSAAPLLLPEIAESTVDPHAVSALVERLATDPPWRDAFFVELARNAPAYGAATDVLHQLAYTRAPPTPAEISPLLMRMVQDGASEEAYQAWMTFLPAAVRPQDTLSVFDSGFKRPPGPAPFGWKVNSSPEAEAVLDPAGEGPGLHVRYGGFTEAEIARQMLLLRPGRYRLSTRARLNQGIDGGVEWRLGCPGVGQLAMTTLRFSGAAPVTGESLFDVPAGCPAQVLSLRTIGVDRRSDVLATIDEVRVVPVELQP